MNDEYLYRVTLNLDWTFKGDKSPVYVVSSTKDGAKEYVSKHLKKGCTIKNISLLGTRLGINIFHGKPKNNVVQQRLSASPSGHSAEPNVR
jgi:hypothetical protein